MPSLRHVKLQGTSQLRIARRERTRLDSRNRSQNLYSWQSDPGFLSCLRLVSIEDIAPRCGLKPLHRWLENNEFPDTSIECWAT